MSEWLQDIFYDDRHLSHEDRKALMIDAFDKSYNWRADQMIGSKRQKIDGADFHEILDKMKPDSIFRFIFRRGNAEDENNPDAWWEWQIEIVFNELGYYLWINLKQDLLPYFEEKYNLKPR